jgi:hypothetical protein
LEGVGYIAVAYADPGYDAEKTYETDDTRAGWWSMSVWLESSEVVEKGRTNTYIEPSVKTTLRMIFCLSSRVSLHTIGIGRARIIRSAVMHD